MPNTDFKRKLILFTYESKNVDELTAYINNEVFKFDLFSIPISLNDNIKFENLKKNSFLFYLYLNDSDLYFNDSENNFYITQKCNKGRVLGSTYYRTNEIDKNLLKSKNFYLDISFNRNDNYKFYKDPNGKKIESTATKLILVLSFICEKESENLLEVLSDLLTSYDFSDKEFSENDLNNYLNFLLKLNETFQFKENTSFFICCCLGLINYKNFTNIKTKLINTITDIVIANFQLMNADILKDFKTIAKFFFDGINLIIYSCINLNSEFNQCLNIIIALFNTGNIGEIFYSNLNKKNYFYDKDKLKQNSNILKEGLKELNNDDNLKSTILKFFLQITPDFECMFVLLDIFENENRLENFISMNWNDIKGRILSLDKVLVNVRENFLNFQKYIKYFRGKENEFFYCFLQSTDNEIRSSVIKSLDIYENKEAFFMLLRILNKLEAKLEPFNYLDLVNVIEWDEISDKFNKNEQTEEENESQNKFKKELCRKLKSIHPPFSGEELSHYMHMLNSRYFFPNGVEWKQFFSFNFINCLKNSEHVKQILNEVIIINLSQMNAIDELKPILINFLFKLDRGDLKEFLNCVSNFFRSMDANQELTVDIKKDIFNLFLQKYKNNDIVSIIELADYSELFQSEIYKDLYFMQVQSLLKKLKAQNSDLIINVICNIKLKFDDEKSIKSNVLSSIFSNLDNNRRESMKKILFDNPSEKYFWFKIIEYLKHYPELNKIEIINRFLDDLRFFYGEILLNKLTMSEIKDLKKLNGQNLKVIDFYFQAVERTNAELVIKQLIKKADDLNEKKNKLEKALDFVKTILDDYEMHRSEIKALIGSMKTQTFNEIKIEERLNMLLNLFVKYEKYEPSVCFRDIFEKFTIPNATNSTKLGLKEIKNIIDRSVETYQNVVDKLKKSEQLDKNFFIEHFTSLDTQEKIENEINILNKMFGLDKTKDVVLESLKNFSEFHGKNQLYSNLIKSFEIFNLGSNKISKSLKDYMNLENENYNIGNLNRLVKEIDLLLTPITTFKNFDNLKRVIVEISKADKLVKYLQKITESDIRNMIDSFDEHGDDHIRLQNILELLKVFMFFNLLSASKEDSEFLIILRNIIERDESEGFFKNLDAIIQTSSNLLDSLEYILNNLQFREEASKKIILELGKNAEFEIEFDNKTEKFSIKTFRKHREFDLNDLNDLRDRAYLMANNRKKGSDYLKKENEDNLEESKEIFHVFISSIDLLNNIVSLCNLIHENGYPDIVKEICKQKLNIVDKYNRSLVNFIALFKQKQDYWNKVLNECTSKYSCMCYFWGKEILQLEDCLIKKNIRGLTNKLKYANLNALEKNASEYINSNQYPSIEKKNLNERLEILSEYIDKLLKSIPKEEPISIPNLSDKIVDNYFEKNKHNVICVKCEPELYLNALLISFSDLIGFYPKLNQLLFCSSHTTLQEVKSFFKRMQNQSNNKSMFAAIGVERLGFELQSFYADLCKEITITGHKIKHIVITCDENSHVMNFLKQSSQMKKSFNLKNYYNKLINDSDSIKDICYEWRQNITLVTSAYAGLGKSTQIEKTVFDTYGENAKILKFPIYDYESLEKNLTKFKDLNENENLIYHLDITHSNNNNELMNEFLFQFIFLRMFKKNNQVFPTNQVKHFYVEISNSFKNKLFEQIYFTKLVKCRLHIECFNMNSLIINRSLFKNHQMDSISGKKDNQKMLNDTVEEKTNYKVLSFLNENLEKINDNTNSKFKENYIDFTMQYKKYTIQKIPVKKNFEAKNKEPECVKEKLKPLITTRMNQRNADIQNNFNMINQNFMFQLVCSFLELYDENLINSKNIFIDNCRESLANFNFENYKQPFMIESIAENEVNIILIRDFKIMKENRCIDLINKLIIKRMIFLGMNINKFSFIQFINLINFLGYYLIKFSKNGYLKVENIHFITSSIDHQALKNIILQTRSDMMSALIDLSINGISQSVTMVHQNQNNNISNMENLSYTHETQLMDQIVNFNNCNYLMIAFYDNDNEFKLIFSHKNKIPKNLCKIFKSQNLDILKKGSSVILNYMNDDNDKSIFLDYQGKRHEYFLKLLTDIIKPKNFKIKLDASENLNSLSCLNQIKKLNEKYEKFASKLVDKSYIITADNFIKMILIYIKLKSNLPIVIMGETGCGKTSLISYMALKLLGVKLLIFNIHAGISQQMFINQINDYFSIANSYNNEEILLFFDEFNTSDCMYIITEMITKRTLLGESIPVNLKLLAACNPYKLKNMNKINVGLEVKERKHTLLVHTVLPIPQSLIEHIWDYGSLNKQDERSYIKNMIESLRFTQLELVCDLISASQQFIKSLEDVSSVSLRDVDRFRIFYQWFNTNIPERNKLSNNVNSSQDQELELKCILLSLFMVYYVRLSDDQKRRDYFEKILEILIENKFNCSIEYLKNFYENEQDEYLARMNPPKGIARNKALRENVFVTFVCIMNKIPVFICGKPGCSKTLCIELLISNLKGK